MSQSQEESTVDPRLDFSLLNSLLILLDLPLTRESDTKKLSNFAKLQFLNNRIDQRTNFTKYFLYNCKFYNSRIEALQNCSAFFMSVSLARCDTNLK